MFNTSSKGPERCIELVRRGCVQQKVWHLKGANQILPVLYGRDRPRTPTRTRRAARAGVKPARSTATTPRRWPPCPSGRRATRARRGPRARSAAASAERTDVGRGPGVVKQPACLYLTVKQRQTTSNNSGTSLEGPNNTQALQLTKSSASSTLVGSQRVAAPGNIFHYKFLH